MPALESSDFDVLAPTLSPERFAALQTYADQVQRWNKVLGLVSTHDLARFVDRHLLAALIAVDAVREAQRNLGRLDLRLMDLGTGAGLPGIPLAAALPEVQVTLVDRSERKARFLRRVQPMLELRNLNVLCADLAEVRANSCHIVTARALMPPSVLWPSAKAMLKGGGRLLAFDRIVHSRQAMADIRAKPEDFPGGSILGRHWHRIPRLLDWHGLLVVGKDDSNHSGVQSEGRRRQNDDQR